MKNIQINMPPIPESIIIEHPSYFGKDEIEKETYKKGFTQWNIDGNTFYPNKKTINILPAGYYTFYYNDIIRQVVLEKKDIILDDLLILPDKSFNSILNDIKQFWTNKENYRRYHYIYKRGILLYGIPGCGKTSLINLICHNLITEQNGIVLNIKEADDLYRYNDIIDYIREIEPDRSIITIIEDIDNFVNIERNSELTTKLLNILDGNMQTDNIIMIATTNFPEKLQERITNRPSRFDRYYEICKPDDEVRKFYIEKKMKSKDLDKIDITEWVKKTDGFTIDHLKELFLSVFVLGEEFNLAVKTIKNMADTKILKNNSGTKKKLGFDA